MKISIMQPYLFPSLAYWQLFRASDKFVILDDVNYIKRGWINRNRVVIAGGDHLFTAPVAQASQNRLIKYMEFADDKWKSKLATTLNKSYARTPFFKSASALVDECLGCQEKNVSKFILNSFRLINAYMGTEVDIVESSSIYNSPHTGHKRIVDICAKEKSSCYINSIGGKLLYSADMFTGNGMELKFLKSDCLQYKQNSETFIPNLSIIDVIMNNSKEDVNIMLNQYQLID